MEWYLKVFSVGKCYCHIYVCENQHIVEICIPHFSQPHRNTWWTETTMTSSLTWPIAPGLDPVLLGRTESVTPATHMKILQCRTRTTVSCTIDSWALCRQVSNTLNTALSYYNLCVKIFLLDICGYISHDCDLCICVNQL